MIPEVQSLILARRELEGHRTLYECDAQSGSTLRLAKPLRDGIHPGVSLADISGPSFTRQQ